MRPPHDDGNSTEPLMAGRPFLLDNEEEGTSHADALSYLLDDLAERHGLSVATGYVDLDGLHHVATTVTDQRSVRLLIGVAPDPGLGHQATTTRFDLALSALRDDRDLSRFPPSRAATKLLALQDWLERPEVEVRRYIDRFLHGKAYLFGDRDDARAALVTSANLTGAGLHRNLELGLAQYDPPVAEQAVAWFERLWDVGADFKADLLDLLFPDVGLVSPRDVYLRALLELLDVNGEQSEGPTPSAVRLTGFQLDGFRRALQILERHRGVVYADGVGTGKTEIGLALVEEYTQRRGLHALVVAPAQLVEHWSQRIHQARLSARVISYHQLAADEQLVPTGTAHARRHLDVSKDTYRLIVMDEGHALRTPDTTWYRAATRLLGGQPKDLALLTATPINNGLWDLYHLVMAFSQHDRAFVTHGIPSLRKLFLDAGANERDPENLSPEKLFSLADMVSVRRDRQFIEQEYSGATFPDGTPVAFPTPELTTERYDLDTAYPDLVRTITTHVSNLSMARYRPGAYRTDGQETVQEAVLCALLQSAILKRFESCWHACRLTLERMIDAHRVFLDAWDQGRVLSGQALQEAMARDLDETGMAEWLEETLEETGMEPIDRYDPGYRKDVAADHDRLTSARRALQNLSSDNDPKLDLLQRLLRELQSQKVIVFSAFADTVRYLDQHLADPNAGRTRVTVVGAETSPDERTRLLARFCPETVMYAGYEPPDGEVDMLLSNDVLSEGQNLQQAAAVISYDMPWNPQRVVQRYGRVVRLRSPHSQVSLITMLPEQGDLEMMLQLETAIRRKIVAARPYGMEIDVVQEDAEEEIRSYAQRLAAGDAALLDDTHTAPGHRSADGEQLRAELHRAASEGELQRVRQLPWGVGAAFAQGPDVPSVGPPGVFFACRLKSGDRYWRYVADNGSMSPEVPTALARINPGRAPGVADPDIDVSQAWTRASASIVEEHNRHAAAGPDELGLGPIQQWARGHLQSPEAAGRPQSTAAYEALGVERSSQVRRDLHRIKRDLDNKVIDDAKAAQKIIDVVAFYGLRPVDPPEPPSPITEDDIGVVCWMAVLPAPTPS